MNVYITVAGVYMRVIVIKIRIKIKFIFIFIIIIIGGVNYLLLVYENSDILNLLKQILYFVEVEKRRKKKSVSLRLDVK